MKKNYFTALIFTLSFLIPFFILCNTPIHKKPDITALIADIKYNQGKIKILELGEIPRSNFTGHVKLYGDGKIWHNLWNHLTTFGLPIWYVGETLDTVGKHRQIASETLYNIGGKTFSTINQLKEDPLFINHMHKKIVGNGDKISDYHGIIIFRRYKNKQTEIETLKKECPNFIYLNEAAAKHVNNKHKTSLAFNATQLNEYRPQWEVYTKNFACELSDKISADFTTDTLVIKPVNCANGWGVIITHKKRLNATLNLILNYPDVCATIPDRSFSQWAHDRNNTFLVEEFIESQPLSVNNNLYDPTLRMIFMLHHDQGKSDMHFLGSYWKLPELALNEHGSLTKKHKSKINPKKQSSEKVSVHDEEKVQTILRSMMPTLYDYMLEPLSIKHI